MLLSVKGIFYGYPGAELLFRNIHLDLGEGKVLALIGESGCGKTTLLSLIYGLHNWPAGEMFFDGKRIFGPKVNIVPGEPKMKLVAQQYDLMPFITVAENVGKFLSNLNFDKKKQRINELLKVTGMEHQADRLAKNLSGGEKQRVAIAQALAEEPKLLLLDEPFSNLDFSRKNAIRDRIFRYVQEHGISVIISTHEFQEVMPWVDDVAVLQSGRLIQRGSPELLFTDPYNDYVANLLGEVNILSEEEQKSLMLKKRFYFPHQISIVPMGVSGTVRESRFAGSHYRNIVEVRGKEITVFSLQRISGNVYLKFQE